MPRQPRYDLPGVAQHVVQRGNNRQPVFFAAEDYERYREDLGTVAKQHGCAIHAYVLMTNHVHLLMTPLRTGALPKTMQALGRRYVAYVNHTYQRTGTLWEGRYKACLVQSERYLLTCHHYIEDNPVRAGMVDHPSEYAYSSYHANADGKPDSLIRPDEVYTALGDTPAQRQTAYRESAPARLCEDTLKAIHETTNQCLVLGNDRFKDAIERELKRKVRPGVPGRPRKGQSGGEQFEIAV